MTKGQCNCGAVRYEIDANVSDVYVCHCSICRRASGVHGMAVAVVDNQVFEWTTGHDQVSSWQKPETDWETWFCQRCGSAVPGTNDENRMFVPVGTITDGAGSLQVKHHMFVDSKAPWFEIGDSGRQHTQRIRND